MYGLELDHPDIVEIERWGYPKGMQGKPYWDEDGFGDDEDDEDDNDNADWL